MKRFFSLFMKAIQKLVRRIPIGRDKPKVLKDAGFDFFWDDEKLQASDYPVSELSMDELSWNLDLPHWEEESIDDWNLTPREVIKHPEWHKNHHSRIQNVNFEYPIITSKNKDGKWFVLDGTHRLAKACIDNQETINAKIIPGEKLIEFKKEKR